MISQFVESLSSRNVCAAVEHRCGTELCVNGMWNARTVC